MNFLLQKEYSFTKTINYSFFQGKRTLIILEELGLWGFKLRGLGLEGFFDTIFTFGGGLGV